MLPIRILGSRDENEALAELSKLEIRIRWPKLKKVVKKELENVIKRRKLVRSEIEESLVPDFGLRDGIATHPFDGVSAIIKLGKADKPTLDWKLDDGKVSKVFPKSLASKNPDAKAQATAIVSDIEKMRAAQRTRLDLLMRRPRSWAFDVWRERYIDHGLVGTLARRLIWMVDDVPVIWKDGKLVDDHGKARSFSLDSTVRIWHPAARPVDEAVAWRSAIESWEISQPFKQAHREIYLLTDAERRTNTYSNRFAAHIVRAITLLSISQVRQWKSGLYGGASSPSFELADHGLIAQWWMEAAGDDHTPFGTPLYLATDQVRFVRVGENQTALPLDQIPLLAFSEILRDVDLFVALSSVGNNPNWQDGGPNGRFRNYWQRYSFGVLTESAKSRRATLERLLPRLSFRDRATLTDKFLIIQGSIRTYKIHLGSGNILMEPNDQYLCIVADRSAKSTGVNEVFLPFEGDSMLSIILSKAFLLVDDKSINDETITRQIRM
ncbi:MAG TPA: DUF4132 domain-containing protein [Tepidisphaeraceae bacterium]|nr:DUF4132 domain-containing protein [Tepidisphaeraceae bacterium]